MATYEYRCPGGHITEQVRPMVDRELPAECFCGAGAEVIFSPPNPDHIRIPLNFRSKYGAPTWSDFHDRSEKEMAKDPNIERAAVRASRPGVGNTISQPGPELKRKVRESRDRYPAHSA
jgi:hypothetical protein